MAMLYWECKRRLNTLAQFRALGSQYFTNLTPVAFGRPPQENQAARMARLEMNRILGEVVESIDLLGMSRLVYYTPPPRIGGFAGPMDMLANLFELWRFQLDPRQALDLLERAIGEYQRRTFPLFLQLFNPFFWVKWLLGKVLSVPFAILGAAGFNAQKLEQSLLGKTVKGVVGLVAFIASLLGVLNYLDLLEPVKKLVQHLRR